MQKQPAVTTRTLARTPLLGLLLALAACGNSPLDSAAGAFRQGLLGGPDLGLSRADVAKIPYASIAVRLGRGPEAFVVLAQASGPTRQWIAADRHLLETQAGRITKTIGFPVDLTHSEFVTPDPLARHLDPTRTYALERIIDVTDHQGPTGDTPTDTLLVRSTLTCQGPRTITLLGIPVPTYLWTETATAPDLKWSQTNQYWQDQNTPTIWKSRQYTAPQNPPITITLLRPYKE
jgi:hypothetical protein